MPNVYTFPPVGPYLGSWTVLTPVQSMRAPESGRTITSGFGRVRRRAQTVIPAMSAHNNRAGAGYLENLKILLAGGQHLVRLTSPPINWHMDASRLFRTRGAPRINWFEGDQVLNFEEGSDALNWYDGAIIDGTVTTDDGWPAVSVVAAADSVIKLPPDTLIARPGEFVTVFQDETDFTGATRRVLTAAHTDDTGTAVIRLFEALPFSGRVDIGTNETAVFRPVSTPSQTQPQRANWFFDWSWEEVFADEYVGGFTDVDPW